MREKIKISGTWIYLVIVLVTGAFAVLLLTSCSRWSPVEETAVSAPTLTPEPLLPTRTPVGQDLEEHAGPPSDTATPESIETPEPQITPTSTLTPPPPAEVVKEPLRIGKPEDLSRFGIAGDLFTARYAAEDGMPFSHLLNWHVVPFPIRRDFTFWQMVRLGQDGIRETTWEQISRAIAANRGSYWLVGNEPDVIWQDNVTPERYAELYHEVYTFIKERDPSAKLVIGGVSQPTPLRRAYLDIVLDTYETTYGQPMPIDIWNVHAFTLREEAGSWGVDIPPGMEGQSGILYEIEDHKDVSIIRQNLIDFRAWMAERGYGDKPLVISEFGILMPEDYGFPIEVLGEFMIDTFELFLTEANETGYAPDDYRLVQWWFWYILYEEDYYPYSRLYDLPEEKFTPLGEIWTAYLRELAESEPAR